MKKLIKALGFTLLGLTFLWAAAGLTLFLCYIYLAGYTHYATVGYVVLMSLFALTLIAVSAFAVKMKKVRDAGELKGADILGGDIKEAYSFGQVGMLVTDEKGTIVWYNEYLEDNGLKAIDEPLASVFSDISKLNDNPDPEATIKVSFANRVFSVKLIKEANLYIFKDITRYESLKEVSINESPVIGFMQIDNYSDLSSSMEETDFAGLMSDLRKTIGEFANTYDMYIRSIKQDTFMVLCGFASYKKMAADGFSVVDIVREAFSGKITLSLGFSYGYPDFPKLAQSANESLEVALSRGGDQVAVSPFGENMLYIGGSTESKGSFNRTKIRILSQSFITTVKNASNVMVIGHYMADFDSIGACLGVMSICDSIGVPCKIIYDAQNVEKNCRYAFARTFSDSDIKKMTANYNEAIDLINDKTLIVVVDINYPDRLLYQNFVSSDSNVKVAIIDHHRRSDSFFKNVVFNGIDSSASSACELVASYISASQVRISLPKDFATFMLAGTMVDTDCFRNKVTPATFEAMAVLKNYGADTEKADEFIKEDYEQFQMKTKILNNAETPFTGVMIATDPDKNELLDRTILAIVSQQAMSISGFDASFTLGRVSETEIGISARSNGAVNVEQIMRKMGGGGHFAAAAATIKGTDVDKVKEDLVEVLTDYLPDAKDRKRITQGTNSLTFTGPLEDIKKTNGGNQK